MKTCRQEGLENAPHGPTPCGSLIIDGRVIEDECACGCTPYGDACPVLDAWLKDIHERQACEGKKRR